MKNDKFFKIVSNSSSVIDLKQAEALTSHPIYYDPLELWSLESPYYAASMLRLLESFGFIKKWVLIKELPKLPPQDTISGRVY